MLRCFEGMFSRRTRRGSGQVSFARSGKPSDDPVSGVKTSTLGSDTSGHIQTSWLSIDSYGEVSLHEVDLSAAALHFRVPERDLKLADPQQGLRLCPSRLILRGQATIACLESLRLVVGQRDALLLSVPEGHSLSTPAAPFTDNAAIRDLISRLRICSYPDKPNDYVDKSLPFEIVVLEWALSTATKLLADEVEAFERAATPVLDDLARKVSHKAISRLRHIKIGVADLSARMQGFIKAIEWALRDVSGDPSDTTPRRRGRSNRHRRRRTMPRLVLEPDTASEFILLLKSYQIQVESTLNIIRSIQNSSSNSDASLRLTMKMQRVRLGHC